MSNRTARSAHGVWLTVVALLATAGLGGCNRSDAIDVRLHARAPQPFQGMVGLAIQAQVTGDPDGLRYRWYSLYGECDPQESDHTDTFFTFPDGITRDRVSVEVSRGANVVARAEVDVALDEAAPGVPSQFQLSVEITDAPPWSIGGDETRADIAGRVLGTWPPDAQVIVYARAYDSWFIQPTAQAAHPIKADGSWSSWTHGGESYAALVVRNGYVPLPRLDILPRLGGNVLGRVVAEGRKD